MEVTSTYKYARISPFKAREVTREIQGLTVAAALDICAFSPKKAAVLVQKTLRSAVANAENNADLRAENLVVKEAVIGEGPTLKRSQPKARGSAGPIRKRSSHIRIVLTDEIEKKSRESKKVVAKTKKTSKKNVPQKAKPQMKAETQEAPKA